MFCLQPVRAPCKGLWSWSTAWFPARILINNGYCQGNIWAVCYNEHLETHQHTPTTCPMPLPEIPSSPLSFCLPHISISLPPFYSFYLFSDFSLPAFFKIFLVLCSVICRVQADSWDFLERKSEGSWRKKKSTRNCGELKVLWCCARLCVCEPWMCVGGSERSEAVVVVAVVAGQGGPLWQGWLGAESWGLVPDMSQEKPGHICNHPEFKRVIYSQSVVKVGLLRMPVE